MDTNENKLLSAAPETYNGGAMGAPIMTLYMANSRENDKNTLYPNIAHIRNAQDLVEAVKRDHMACRMKDNYRTTGNFIECGCIMVDIDNSHSEEPYDWKTEKDIAEAFPFNYFLVRSRNYMKQKRKLNKKTGVETVFAPREKWHIYIPLRKAIHDAKMFEAVILSIELLFPWIDPGAMDNARFFYGVTNPYVAYEDNDQFADDYLYNPDNDDEIRKTQREAVKAFLVGMESSYTESKENNTIVQRCCAAVGIPVPPSLSPVPTEPAALSKGGANTAPADIPAPAGLDWITAAEQAKSVAWLETWAVRFGVVLGARYMLPMSHATHPGGICICVDCPWESQHTEDTGEKQTVLIVDRGGKINFLCRHGHCVGRSWQDFRAYHEAKGPVNTVFEQNDRATQPAAQPAQLAPGVPPEMAIQDPGAPVKFENIISAADLLEMDVPDPVAIVGVGEEVPLLCEGTCILSAKPKCGKSWLALAMCIAVANGESFLGYKTKKCRALYLDLESGMNIRKKRLKKAIVGHEVPNNFDYVGTSRTLDTGILDQIENYIKDYPDTGLVIIDVFEKVRTAPLSVRETDYRHAYRDLDPLNAIAEKYHISIVVVSHNRKAIDPDDPFANILGSTGLQAAVSQMIVLQKRRSEGIIQLFCQGRPMDGEISFGTKLDAGQWSIVGGANSAEREKERLTREYMESPIRAGVLAIMDDCSMWKGRCSSIIDEAVQRGIAITDTAKAVGGFLHRHQGRMLETDGIKLQIIQHGTASKVYKLTHVDTDMEPDEMSLPAGYIDMGYGEPV